MGTWTRFYINSSDIEKLTANLIELTKIDQISTGEIPEDYNDSFLLDETLNPNYLMFAMIQDNWITILYNSGSKIEDWAKILSKKLNCNLIVTIGQNTVDYYYFSQYNKGIKQREIEVCYGDEIDEINIGEPYDFEDIKPGEKHEDDGEITYLFDFDSLSKYSQHFGLEIESDWGNIEWKILRAEQNQITTKEYVNNLLANKKPWWKFW